MNILFLHSSRHAAEPWKDGSTRYRCYHLAEALQQLDHIADVMSLQHIELGSIHRYDVVVVLRPSPGRKLDKILSLCRHLDIHTVADVDDLIFVPEYASHSPSVLNGQAAESVVRNRFRRNAQAMLAFDEIIVATEPLAVAWKKISGNIGTVVSNGISERWLDNLNSDTRGGKSSFRRITYLPGSSSHDTDFAQIIDALAFCLAQHPDCELLILGSLSYDSRKLPRAQTIHKEWTDYHNLPALIASSTVTLAPLVPSPFTYAKSHIKFIESAAFGTPAICSPNHDLCRHSIDGLYIAHSAEDWQESLQQVLSESSNAGDQHSALKNYARSNCSATNSAQHVLSHWQQTATVGTSANTAVFTALSSAR